MDLSNGQSGAEARLHSIVVPVYNSRPTLPLLVEEVRRVLDSAGLAWELILVDDGSADGSFAEIKRLAGEEPRLRGLRLSRNFGHQAALTVGLRESRGDFVAIIDDDLQDPPSLLPRFFARLDQGADVVYGQRRKRKEGLVKRVLYAGFYRVLRLLSEIEIPLDSGDFCAMRRNVVEAMLELREAPSLPPGGQVLGRVRAGGAGVRTFGPGRGRVRVYHGQVSDPGPERDHGHLQAAPEAGHGARLPHRGGLVFGGASISFWPSWPGPTTFPDTPRW